MTDTLGFPILGTVPEMSAKELNAGIRKRTSSDTTKATNDKQRHHAEAAQESRRKENGTNTETKQPKLMQSVWSHSPIPLHQSLNNIVRFGRISSLPPQLVSKSKRLL